MARRLSAFALAAGLVAAQFGCNSSQCNSRPGLFTGHSNGCAPCQTAGRNTGCFDAATGQPVPCPPDAPGMLMPGGPYPPPPVGPIPIPGGAIPRPDELHMPQPTELIPRPAVPIPAPGDASLPFPAMPGTPVKGAPNK